MKTGLLINRYSFTCSKSITISSKKQVILNRDKLIQVWIYMKAELVLWWCAPSFFILLLPQCWKLCLPWILWLVFVSPSWMFLGSQKIWKEGMMLCRIRGQETSCHLPCDVIYELLDGSSSSPLTL